MDGSTEIGASHWFEKLSVPRIFEDPTKSFRWGHFSTA